jgi:hypothetical protein
VSWSPPIALRADERVYRVGATDAEDAEDGGKCPLHLALKVRPRTVPETGAWAKRRDYFMLGILTDAIQRVNFLVGNGTDLWEAVESGKSAFTTEHSGVRLFLGHALDRFFEYHEAREVELGPLRLVDVFPSFEKGSGARLSAWGALYESASGNREMRRFRITSARDRTTAWAYVAAHVAAEARGQYAVSKVWVTEIGLNDGIEAHVLSGITRREAANLYVQHGRPAVMAATRGTVPKPGRACSSCKLTGSCAALIPVPGFMQVTTVGPSTLSLAASDLERYDRCPAQWYMEAQHLPKQVESNEAALRGIAVHQWLRAAHERGIPCSLDDLPLPGSAMPAIGADFLDETLYALGYPYLRSHVDCCPLKDGPLDAIATERTIYGYDSIADVVVATKADAVWRRNGTVVVREIKTTQDQINSDADGMLDRHIAVPWDLVALSRGMAQHFGAAVGQVELEVLTPNGGEVFTYRTDDEALMKMAVGQLRRLTKAWMEDAAWATMPSPGCTTCGVRRWCGARDQWDNELSFARRAATDIEPEEETPPF